MTSQERREGRYQRRKAKRQAKKQARCDALGPINKVFSYRKMFRYGRKCCNGVRWKQSVQNFELHLFSGTAKRRRQILDKTWKPRKCVHFTLCERGKVRPIDAPHVTDRQIHKTHGNEVLIPLYSPSMIYDNGASQRGKGLHWHFKRIKEQLHWHYRRYGRTGAVGLLDLKGFFPNAPRWLIYQRHQQLILNPDLCWTADTVVAYSPCTTPERGMPLGVEPSQQEMVALPSAVDNWLKCQMSVHCAGHYMDDYYIIMPDVEQLKAVIREMVRRFEALGIRVNKRKCKIIPLTKPFRFCKARFTLGPTGKITVNGSRDGVKRARRKLKMFYQEFKAGKRPLSDAEQFMECQSAYYRVFNDHGRLLRLRRLYHAIFFWRCEMFRIIKDGVSIGMTETPNYIKQAENGCYVLCPEPEASGIAFEGTQYHLLGRDALEGLETVRLEETDAGGEITKVSATGGIVFVTMAEAGNIDAATAAEHADFFAEWAYPINYKTGNIRRYGGKLYRCVKDHTSQEDWTPEAAASLWAVTADPAEEWPAWSQPVGAHDAYNAGDKVSHNDKHWTSNQDGNVWEPGVYGWSEAVEEE